jgi:hypothetical protein
MHPSPPHLRGRDLWCRLVGACSLPLSPGPSSSSLPEWLRDPSADHERLAQEQQQQQQQRRAKATEQRALEDRLLREEVALNNQRVRLCRERVLSEYNLLQFPPHVQEFILRHVTVKSPRTVARLVGERLDADKDAPTDPALVADGTLVRLAEALRDNDRELGLVQQEHPPLQQRGWRRRVADAPDHHHHRAGGGRHTPLPLSVVVATFDVADEGSASTSRNSSSSSSSRLYLGGGWDELAPEDFRRQLRALGRTGVYLGPRGATVTVAKDFDRDAFVDALLLARERVLGC